MNNEEYFAALLEKYGDTVMRVAYTYLKNRADAEDVVQDVFMKLIDKNPTFADTSHEKAWFIRVTINICKNRINLFWNKNKCNLDDFVSMASYDNYHADNEVLSAVMSLPEKYRIAVYMYYYEGYSGADIAKIMNKTESGMRTILMRAREKLKNILKEADDFEQEIQVCNG